jgi:S-adenosylmethionine uptake transporter
VTGGPADRPWNDRRQAVLLYVGSGLVFSVLDAYTKAVVATMPVVGALWARGIVFFVLFLLVANRREPRRLLDTRSPRLQVARGVALFAATFTFFFSLSLVPLGEAVALASASPLIVIALAGPLLNERVTKTAAVGTIVGFCGVVLLVELDPAGLDPRSLLPLATAAFFAAFALLSRAVGHESEGVTLFYTGAVGLVLATLTFLLLWPGGQVGPSEWVAAGFVGVLSLVGHALLTMAYRRGQASDLAPFGYLAIVWGFLIGAVVFGEAIDPGSVVGATAIALGGLMALRGVVGETPEAAVAAQPGRDPANDDAEAP